MVVREAPMPLRDHFQPPVSKKASWEGFHAMWPTCVVQHLRNRLPPGFVAEPRVHLGTLMEAAWTASVPAVAVETEPPGEYEYEVRIFDVERERQLLAAIAFVSPAHKDRPESRDAFVARCAALLRRGVAVGVVDLVTIRRFNLYAQLMAFVGQPDPAMTADEPPTYAASCRWVTKGTRARLEAWFHTLTIGQSPATSTTLVSSLNPAQLGQAVTFTATVAVTAPGSNAPQGTVTFFDGATPWGPLPCPAARPASPSPRCRPATTPSRPLTMASRRAITS